jgi:site-specific recombinase XerD
VEENSEWRMSESEAAKLITTAYFIDQHGSTPKSGLSAEIPIDPVVVYLSHLAPGSRRTMAQALSTLSKILSGGLADLHTFDWSCLTYEHTSTLPALLSSDPHNLSPATINKMLSALRGCLRECANLKRMTWEQFNAATQIRCKVAHKEPPGRSLSRGEIEALMEATEGDGVQAVRDRAILALLYGAGLQRAEAAALKLADYDPETGRILVRSGKGGKDRAVFLAGRRKAALECWIDLRGQEPGGLLQPTRAGKVWVSSCQCMTPDALFKILERLGESAKLKDFSPHYLRRSYISDLIDAGADLLAVQRLVGHASVNTTARYDRRSEAAAKKAAAMIDL